MKIDTSSWLRVSRTPGVGPITFHCLYKRFPNASSAINFLSGRGKAVPSTVEIDDELDRIHCENAFVIFCEEPNYPYLLRQINDAPPFLIGTGKSSLLKNSQNLAIVGSRSSSLAGNNIARRFATELVDAGYTVVSGLARGIDRHAHLGGIKSTIAVIAQGIDRIYPPDNTDLYMEIKSHGLILTEAPYGTQPVARLFHGRNRIVAGLSKSTIVVQAAQNSGSLITAQYALDYNRDVCAVPGCPLDARSHGSNFLIQNGAYLVQTTQDVLKYIANISVNAKKILHTEALDELDPELGIRDKLISLISTNPISIDELQQHVNISIGKLRSALVELELDSLITMIPGSRVMKI